MLHPRASAGRRIEGAHPRLQLVQGPRLGPAEGGRSGGGGRALAPRRAPSAPASAWRVRPPARVRTAASASVVVARTASGGPARGSRSACPASRAEAIASEPRVWRAACRAVAPSARSDPVSRSAASARWPSHVPSTALPERADPLNQLGRAGGRRLEGEAGDLVGDAAVDLVAEARSPPAPGTRRWRGRRPRLSNVARSARAPPPRTTSTTSSGAAAEGPDRGGDHLGRPLSLHAGVAGRRPGSRSRCRTARRSRRATPHCPRWSRGPPAAGRRAANGDDCAS